MKKETKQIRARRLRSQGRYIGALRKLTIRARRAVVKTRREAGIREAMRLARKLAA